MKFCLIGLVYNTKENFSMVKMIEIMDKKIFKTFGRRSVCVRGKILYKQRGDR